MSLRVLFVAADPGLELSQQGGAGTHIRGTVAGLRGQGVSVETLVGSPGGEPTIAQRPMPFLRAVAPRPLRTLLRDVRTILHGRRFPQRAAAGFDCVYERSGYLLDVGRRLARAADVPYVLESDGILVEARRAAYGSALFPVADRLERRKHREADLIVVMAEPVRERLVARYDVAPDRIYVKGLGIEAELVQREWKPPDRPLVIGFAGTFQPYHGIGLLVEAAPALARQGLSLLLIGDGPELARARSRAEGLPVEFTGQLSRADTLEGLGRCGILVVPDSSPDMYPIKFLEYAAMGRPIVCPAYPAFSEFRDGDRPLTFQFEPGNPAELAKAILVAASAADAPSRANALRNRIARDYTWDAIGRRLAAALDRLCRDFHARSSDTGSVGR